MTDDVKLTSWSLGDDSDVVDLQDSGKLDEASRMLKRQSVVSYSLAEQHNVAGFIERLMLKETIVFDYEDFTKEDVLSQWKAGHLVFLFGIGHSAIGIMRLH